MVKPSPSQSASETSRQAARREKSLNKIPAMQRVAMELEQASSSPLSAKAKAEVPGIKKSIEVDVDDSGAGVGFAIGALPPSVPLTNGAFQSPVEDAESDIHPDFVAPPSSHPRHSTPPVSSDETNPRSEDDDGGVSTDVFADFDIPSEADKAFLSAHLREAPKEDVTFLLNTRNAPQEAKPVHTKQVPSTPKSQAHNFLPDTPRSLLKYHQRRAIIAEYAHKVAAETIPGTPDANQLKSFLDQVQSYAIGLELGPNQALFEAKQAKEELCRARGIKLETKLSPLEMPGLELTDAIEVLASVQQTVGTLFGDTGVPQDTGAAQNATPNKRKRFRKEKPKIEGDIAGTPLSETTTAESQPEKVMRNDRRSKRQKANIAAVALEAEFAKLNPDAPKMSRRERKLAFIQNKSKEAAAKQAEAKETAAQEAAVKALPIASTVVVAPVVATESVLGEVDPAAPKMTRRERKLAFIQNKAKAAAAAAAAAQPLVAAATVITAANTQPDQTANTQIPPAEVKEPIAATVLSPLAGDATPSDADNKSKKVLKNEERKARRKLERAAAVKSLSSMGGDGPASPKPVVAAPTEKINAADVPAPTTVKADNEVVAEKSSKKRKRGAKNKPNPGAGDANAAPVASQTKATAVNKAKPNDTKSKVAAPILPSATKPADDGFVDMRAPKKKKRGRKSTGAAEGDSNSNTPELVKSEVVVEQAPTAPVEVGKTEPGAEAKPIATAEATEGDSGVSAAGKRKRKRGPPPPKKAPDALGQNPATSTPVDISVPEPMELCIDEPTSKPVVTSIIPTSTPVAAPIIPATQPLSEIAAPNPMSNKRRKRGNRKSIGDENKAEAPVAVGSQDLASGGQPLEVAGQTKDISRRESSSPTSIVKLENGLRELKAEETVGDVSFGAYGEAMIDSEDESGEDQGAETDGEAKVSTYALSVPSEADSDDSREGSALNGFDRRVTRSASREMVSIDVAQLSTPVRQPTFKYDKIRSSTPPLSDSGDEAEDVESPTRPQAIHQRRNSVILPRLAQSPNKSLLQPPGSPTSVTPVKKEKAITKSPYFSPEVSPKKPPRSPGGVVSCIPFPPLSSPSFGLLQEKLCHDPLRLLIGVTFLIRTYGKSSIPIYYKLMELFPTATALANADKDVIVELTRHLGLQSVRADTYIRYAKTFLDDPPVKGKRYRVENYPTKNAHAGIKKGEVLSNDDPREGAWEIGHLTKGPYAIDSWRIFCRDELRGLAKGWNGEEAKDEGFQPEWMRVLPKDKELRAFLRWCWLGEGWVWDAETGEREVAGKELVKAVNDGRVVWEWQGKDGKGDWRIMGKYEKEEGKEEMGVKREAEYGVFLGISNGVVASSGIKK